MPDPTPVDLLLDRFMEALRPPHDRIAGVPYAAIEIRKTDLRASMAQLLTEYESLLSVAGWVRLTAEELTALEEYRAETKAAAEAHALELLKAKEEQDLANADSAAHPTNP